MSPIGRIFLVLNLALAGTFVAFAGTYLERSNHWQEKYNAATKSAETAKEESDKAIQALNDGIQERDLNVTQLTLLKKNLETKNEEQTSDNVALQKRVTATEALLTKLTSSTEKSSTQIAAAFTQAKASMDKALAAEAAKDEAIAAQAAAEKELKLAQFKIKNLTEDVSAKASAIAMRDQTIRNKETLLTLVTTRYPAIFETLHPLVEGSVSYVGASGKMVTISIRSGAENLKPGARFAIFDAKDNYKGEATVSSMSKDKKLAFARLSLDQGKKIEQGDSASTNLSAASGN